jgi:Escherichia/Staphylococcus phage prohead protease
VSGLSIGCAIRAYSKTGAGNELTDLDLIGVSIVARGASDRGSGRAQTVCASFSARLRAAVMAGMTVSRK